MRDQATDNEQGPLSVAVQKITNLCDENIVLIRYSGPVLAVCGLAVLARALRVTKQFVNLNDIPKHFVHKHVRLNGVVKSIGKDRRTDVDILFVRHEPIMRMPFSRMDQSTLPVTLAGVKICKDDADWLNDKLVNQSIWFRLMHRTDDYLVCNLEARRNFFLNYCVNDYLVKQGLAVVQTPDGIDLSDRYKNFISKLQRLESKAQKRGLGVWKRPGMKERLELKKFELKSSMSDRYKLFISNVKDYFSSFMSRFVKR